MKFKGKPNSLFNAYIRKYGKLELVHIGEFDGDGIMELPDDSPYINLLPSYSSVREQNQNNNEITRAEGTPDETPISGGYTEDEREPEITEKGDGKHGNNGKAGRPKGSKNNRSRKQQRRGR